MLRRGKLIAAFLLGSAAALAVTALPPYLFLQQKPQDLPKTLLIDEPIFESTAAFLQHADKVFSIVEVRLNAANWAFETNITDANQEQVTEVELEMNKLTTAVLEEAKKYSGTTNDERRQLELLLLKGGVPSDLEQQRRLSTLVGKMVGIYSTAKFNGMSLEPEITEVMATSRNYTELLEAYLGWRQVTGPLIKPLYAEFVNLLNVGAQEIGYKDAGKLWRSNYDMDSQEFASLVEQVWQQVLPLYEELHCFTRSTLIKEYGKQYFDEKDGYIPGHLLGNPWAQDFSNIYNLMTPFPDAAPVDITPELLNQGYDAEQMHRLSESFYKSLGYDPLPEVFWEKSMLVKPADREAVCHASAWDMGGGEDLRIKMCTVVTGNDLFTIHHEQGHLYYDHYYREQPAIYRESAADFFHEAIGDTMALSVVVPAHLKEIGLIRGELGNTTKIAINALMAVALDKIAVLPWAYFVDLWRWKVFSGAIKIDEYQQEWERLMMHFQGFKRPFPSNKEDFDGGAKYHIPANTPYIRYFGAAVLQFQLHDALCEAAGHKGPLHECSIYNNQAAGDQFLKLLQLGRSKKWQEALAIGTNGKYKTLDGSAILKYFAPLQQWLKEQNKGEKCGWKKAF